MARRAHTGFWERVHQAAHSLRTPPSFAFALAFASAFTLACSDSSTGPSDTVEHTLVFEMVRDGGRDIDHVELDGSEPVRLTSGQHDNRSPTVAAGRVVFTSSVMATASYTPFRSPAARRRG